MPIKYYARRPHNYGGEDLDRGQILEGLGGHRNDEKLTRLGYLQEVPKDYSSITCHGCGMEFIGPVERDEHYSKRHVDRSLTPMDADARIDREEQKLDKIAPLYLDKTAASRGEQPKTGKGK